MIKTYNENGQKAYQRQDREDRSLKYRMWLRTIDTDGFFMDIDFIKWKFLDGAPVPVAITEITRCDSENINDNYLRAIIDRWYVRDKQAEIIKTLATLLVVPAYLICYQKDMLWLEVFDLQTEKWTKFTPQEWATFLRKL